MNRLPLLLMFAVAACGGRDPAAADAAPPLPPDAPAPAPSLTASADVSPPAVPVAPAGAAPLSERRAHDLSVDLMQRTNTAFDGNYPGPPHAVVDDTIVVIGGDPSAPLDAAVKVTRDTVDALWRGPFAHRPDLAVVEWVGSSQASVRALAQKRAPGVRSDGLGLYDPRSRQIFVCANGSGWGSAQHEVVHPLLRADFPLAPAWAVEGIAALFEAAQIDGDQLRFGAHFRLETLRTALGDPALAPEVKLDTLFTWVTDATFRSHESLHYAVAREALRWLHSQGLLWPWYAAWRDGVLTDPTGEQAFQAVVHKSLVEATEPWRAWLTSADAEDFVPRASAPSGRGQ